MLGWLPYVVNDARGSIQTLLLLPDGAALRLTTAQVLRTNGGPISGAGVIPDTLLNMAKDGGPSDAATLDAAVRAAEALGNGSEKRETVRPLR